MDVSVVIPCLNRARFIDDAIMSALDQGDGVEVIVVDDGSTDRSWEKILSYGDRIIALKGEGRGPGAARNRGLGAARHGFIHFLDSDDRLVPGALEAMLDAAKGLDPRRIAVGHFTHIDETGTVIGTVPEFDHTTRPADIQRAQVLSRPLSTPLPLHRADALREVGGFDERLWHNEDRELTVRLMTRGFHFVRVPVVVAQVRKHQSDRLSSDISCSAYGHVLTALKAMRDNLIADPAFMVSRDERDAFANLCWSSGRDASRVKCRSVAEELFALARSIDGRVRMNAHWTIRQLYRFMPPYRAEQLVQLLKKTASLPRPSKGNRHAPN